MLSRTIALLMCTLLLVAGCLSPESIDRWTPHGEPLDNVQVQDFTLMSSDGTSWTYSEQAANTPPARDM